MASTKVTATTIIGTAIATVDASTFSNNQQPKLKRKIENTEKKSVCAHRKKASTSVYPVKSVQPIFAKTMPNPIIPSISGHCNNLNRTPNAWPPINRIAIRVGADVNVTYSGNRILANVHISIPIASKASGCAVIGH